MTIKMGTTDLNTN